MGRKSTRENKTPYQLAREDVAYTLANAASQLYISEDTLSRIEGGQVPQPDVVLSMSEAYREPLLCNYYCNHDCPIGEKYAHEIELKSLSETVINLKLSMSDYLSKEQTLMKIACDNKVEFNEIEDFVAVQEDLKNIVLLSETLKFWTEEMVAEGDIDKVRFEQIKEKYYK